jgi:hypothetical protein
MLKLLFKYIIGKIRLNRAIRRANKYCLLTGKKYYVFRYKNKFLVVSKRNMRSQMAKGNIKASINDIRKIILYETRM